MNKYIAIETVHKDEFVSEKMIINYLNIGKKSEMRLNNLPIDTIKVYNVEEDRMEYESTLRHCIIYLDDEIEFIKKYHPDAIILPYISRLDKLKKILSNDMDVSKRRFNRSLF